MLKSPTNTVSNNCRISTITYFLNHYLNLLFYTGDEGNIMKKQELMQRDEMTRATREVEQKGKEKMCRKKREHEGIAEINDEQDSMHGKGHDKEFTENGKESGQVTGLDKLNSNELVNGQRKKLVQK